MSSENPDFEGIRQRLKELRHVTELSQDMFGKRIGLRRQDINNIESGRRVPGLTVLYRICREYHVSMNWIVFGL